MLQNKQSNVDNLLKYLDINNSFYKNNEEDMLNPCNYSHLLTWISLVYKLNCPEGDKNHEVVKKALKVYLDENK